MDPVESLALDSYSKGIKGIRSRNHKGFKAMRSDCYVWQDGQIRRSGNPAPVQQRPAKQSIWQGVGVRLMSYFSGSNEPQIRQRTYGDQLVWHVYDPVTRQQWQFSTEKEVRVWLEQRYSGS